MFNLRPKQQEILSYTQGRMGISAVPGSGKTWTLSFLAADLLKRRILQDDQEILILTLNNSAVDNFYSRISSFIEARGLIPNIGYRVRTLHGLAHDIVRERPELLGLDSKFQIIDERESDSIRDGIAQAWLKSRCACTSVTMGKGLIPLRQMGQAGAILGCALCASARSSWAGHCV